MFPYDVKDNITLYAGWEINKYTVTFETNGGSSVESMLTSRIETSPETKREGFKFLGWFTDEECEHEVVFPYDVKDNITLYAGWEQESKPAIDFKVDSNGVLTGVSGLTGTDVHLEIPARVNGIDVVELAMYAFRGNTNISEVIIPDSVTYIGMQCFSGCVNLKKVVLPEGLEVIAPGTFERCSSLETINFPQSIKEIRSDAFSGAGLKSVVLTGSVDIWQYAFKDCRQLITLDLGKTYDLGRGAFENCVSLQSVVIPETMGSLKDHIIFNGCTSLTDIKLPDKGIEIMSTMFDDTGYYNDPKNWTNGLLYIDGYLVCAESNFAATTLSVLPGTIAIADLVLQYCNTLTSLTLPEGLLRIGERSFENCSNLTSIEMPNSVVSIGADAFTGTAYANSNWYNNGLYLGNWLLAVKDVKMTSFTIKEGTVGIADAMYNGSLFSANAKSVTSIILPDSLQYIGYGAFSGTSITSVVLPKNLKVISDNAFYLCEALEDVDMNACSALEKIGYSAFTLCKISEISIPASVTEMGELVFNHNTVDLIINCEVSEKPEGWDPDWAFSYREGVTITVNWKK